MEILTILLATFVATSFMTIFSYLVSAAFKELYKEPVLLHYLMTRFHFNLSDSGKRILGWIIHYCIGLLFIIAYFLILKLHWFDNTWLFALIYGCIIGIIGISGWVLMFALADFKPKIDFKGHYLQLFFAHIIFAIAAWLIFQWLLP